MHAASNAELAALTRFNIAQRQLSLEDTGAISLLLNQQVYQQAKLNLIQTRSSQLADTVALFQALGD